MEGKIDLSTLTEIERDVLHLIVDRSQILYEQVNELSNLLAVSASSEAHVAHVRAFANLLDQVNAQLDVCYRALAAHSLSEMEVSIWLPLIAAVRNDLRRASTVTQTNMTKCVELAASRLHTFLEVRIIEKGNRITRQVGKR